jgi:hypothetical protein
MQVAQIRAGLRAKAESEAGLPLSQTQPLQVSQEDMQAGSQPRDVVAQQAGSRCQ